MSKNVVSKLSWFASAIGFAGIGAGYWLGQVFLLVFGSVITLGGFAAVMRCRRRRKAKGKPTTLQSDRRIVPTFEPMQGEGDDEQALVRRMLWQGRYALLLRPQIAPKLDNTQWQQVLDALEAGMAIIPGGQVVLGNVDEALVDGKVDAAELDQYHARLVHVDPVFVDRYAVTNEQYQQFIVGGGYEEMAIWDEEIWPAVLDFVDQTGNPGPRFWREGWYPEGQEKHPVVGISWHEAAAYARWVGKRLVSDAEWVKAGAWPVNPNPGIWMQRKYPWGNSFDHQRANLWGTGLHGTAPANDFEDGLSVGGLYQLIGNVWEWTSGNFGSATDVGLTLPVPMKSIRGGAFDTYFENQATCHFQSGENPLARKHNIGFRLALGSCDLSPRFAEQPTAVDNEQLQDVPDADEVYA